MSGVGEAVELELVLEVEEAAELEEALLEVELVVAAAELEAEQDCD